MGPSRTGAAPALAAALLIALTNSNYVAAAERPHYAAILIDANSREVLYANEADSLRHPASITKIMTLYLTFEALNAGKLKLTDRVVMSRHAAAQRPSKLGLAAGRSLSVEDAIRVIAVKSANDVAVALAERVGGTEPVFAAMMTAKARELGMKNTVFVNASGLPDKAHVTTARDLAILSSSLIKRFPRQYSYFSQQSFSYDKLKFANHNKLLGRMPGMDGIKTGFTFDAGYTLAASAMRSGRRLIAVVLGEPSLAARDRDVTTLLNAGFTVLNSRTLGQPTTVTAHLMPLAHPALRVEGAVEQGSASK